MSHFPVAVISEKIEDIERLMAPYQENNMGDCSKEFLQFYDEEPNCLKQYEEKSVEKIKMPDGRLLNPWDDEFRVDGRFDFGSNTHQVPEDCERVQVKFQDLYPSFDAFMQDWHGSERDSETGKYGYWENPNKKWDYWRLGGRFRGLLKAKKGNLGKLAWEHTAGNRSYTDKPNQFDNAQLKDLILERDEKQYQKALRFWDVVVEGAPLIDGESKEDFFSVWNENYYIDKYGTKETFAKLQSVLCPWALVTPDGKWHEQGDMGFWGMDDADQTSTSNFMDFFEETLHSTNPEYFITILDCHIQSENM